MPPSTMVTSTLVPLPSSSPPSWTLAPPTCGCLPLPVPTLPATASTSTAPPPLPPMCPTASASPSNTVPAPCKAPSCTMMCPWVDSRSPSKSLRKPLPSRLSSLALLSMASSVWRTNPSRPTTCPLSLTTLSSKTASTLCSPSTWTPSRAATRPSSPSVVTTATTLPVPLSTTSSTSTEATTTLLSSTTSRSVTPILMPTAAAWVASPLSILVLLSLWAPAVWSPPFSSTLTFPPAALASPTCLI